MKLQDLLTSLHTYKMLLAVLLLTGCSKNEQAIEEPHFSGVLLQAITADPFRLKVMDSDKELTNALFSPGNRVTVLSTYYEPLRRIKVYNFYGDALLLDTLIPFRGTPYTVTFFQAAAGEKLRWIGPPVGESLPESGSLKVSIIYTAPLLPATLKVVVENALSETGSTYAATDSFQLDKGNFSKYFTGRNIRIAKPRLKMYTADADRKLLATVDAGKFQDTNFDFSIFLFDKASGGGVFNLDSKKLY